MLSLRWSSFRAVAGRRTLVLRRRNIALRDVVVDGRALALLGVAVAAAPGRLHQKTFAGLHLVTPGCGRFEFVRHPEPQHEPAAGARSAPASPCGGKRDLSNRRI